MPLLHIVILAIVQGITEVLPISSSAHLLIAHELLHEGQSIEENLILDIALHVGTLAAVLIYFRRDILGLLASLPRFFQTKEKDGAQKKGAQMVANIIVASIPVVIAGLMLHILQPAWARSLIITPWSLIFFGILLWIADRYKPSNMTFADMTWKHALFIGSAQVLSLVPGTSRSGVTMTAARWLGFSRLDAARFSLFMAIVAISGAGVIGGIGLLEENNAALTYDALAAAAVSCIASYAAIVLMMRWLARASFTPFVAYRIALGIVLLIMIGSGALG